MDLPTIWFCIVSVMVAMYVVFDGFDIGAGIVYLFSARNDEEKRKILKSIGPVWDGNEVWLLAAGGVLYFAFPAVYARHRGLVQNLGPYLAEGRMETQHGAPTLNVHRLTRLALPGSLAGPIRDAVSALDLEIPAEAG